MGMTNEDIKKLDVEEVFLFIRNNLLSLKDFEFWLSCKTIKVV